MIRGLVEQGRVSVTWGTGRSAVACLTDLVEPVAVLNAGVCGACKPRWSAGDEVKPSIVRANGREEIPVANGETGILKTVDEPVLDAESKQALEGDFVDMEAYHLASRCLALNVPFHCAKVVGDTLETPPLTTAVMKECRRVLPQLTISVENAVKNLVNLV